MQFKIFTFLIMMMMMIIIIIIIITLKGAVQDFYNLHAAQQTVFNRYAQVAGAQSCANDI